MIDRTLNVRLLLASPVMFEVVLGDDFGGTNGKLES